MTDLSAFVSEDSRKLLERYSRSNLYRVADHKGIQYPVQIGKIDMLKLLEANGVDLSIPVDIDGLTLQVINGKDEFGAPHQEIYPVAPDHATKNKNIDYDSAIEANSKLTEQQIFENTKKEASRKSFNFPLDKLLPWQLNHMCKDAGISPIPKSKEDMLAALEGGNDVENTVERNQ